MKHLLFISIWILFSHLASAGCIQGDCKQGKGTYVFKSGAKFIGDFQNGKIHGSGILYFSNGDKYLGQWKQQYREGKGKLIFHKGDVYVGHFRKNKFHGIGEMQFANGAHYKGEWLENQPHGEGTFKYEDRKVYVGAFEKGKRHGKGKIILPNGESLEGNWVHGESNIQGRKLQNPPVFAASLPDVDNLPNCNKQVCDSGMGKYIYDDGSIYIGQFRNGEPVGKGKCYYANGDVYEGQWSIHSPNGEGVMHYQNGRKVGARWELGKFVNFLRPPDEKLQPMPSQILNDQKINIWAVIVGVGRYPHMPTLKFTDDDAYQMFAFMKSPDGGALPDDRIKLLIDEAATRDNILNAMQSILLRADQNDVVMFYFSGHGLDGSFLPYDYNGYNNRLWHDEVLSVFDESKAKHKIVLADACYSGSLTKNKSPNGSPSAKLFDAFEQSKGGTALLMSSKQDEVSLEDHGLRQGIFSHFLIKGIKGGADSDRNKTVTINELYQYVYYKVRSYTQNEQTPVLKGNFDYNMPIAALP